jgi:hypothetical protein
MTYLAIGSASRCFDSKRFDKGYQVIQNFQILHHQIRPNRAQLAKLPFVDIYHPLADYDVVSAAINLPVDQLIIEKAYRKALATSFPDLENIPWTFTMAPLSISTKEAILRKVSQLTIGKWLYHKPMGQYPFFRRRRYLSDHFSWSRTVLRNFIEATIMSEELLSMGIFQYAGLQNILTDHFEGKIDATVFIGNALAIALWAKLFYLPSTPNRPKGLLEIGHRGSDQLH